MPELNKTTTVERTARMKVQVTHVMSLFPALLMATKDATIVAFDLQRAWLTVRDMHEVACVVAPDMDISSTRFFVKIMACNDKFAEAVNTIAVYRSIRRQCLIT